jgi:hypothetical protein
MVAGGVGLAGVDGGLGGVAVCPERKDANKRSATVRRINGDSPRGSKDFRIQDGEEESREDGSVAGQFEPWKLCWTGSWFPNQQQYK